MAVFGALAGVARADEAASLAQAQKAADAKDWPTALTAAQGAGALGGDVILWQWLRDGQGRLGDYEAFLQRRPDWPGLPLLKEKGEQAVARSTDPARIIAYFNGDLPRTGQGAVALIVALNTTGQTEAARTEAARAWVALKFSAEDQTAMLDVAGDVVRPLNVARLDAILRDSSRRAEATRMLPLLPADWRALAEARIALQSDAKTASALVAAVPKSVADDPGLAYDRFNYRMRKDDYAGAAEMILTRSKTAEGLGIPENWALRRADLARILMRQGEPKTAYRVASSHHMAGGDGFAELEFLSGYIALRKLSDPATAVKHFQRMRPAVVTAISVARAEYWTGRALDAKGDTAAAKAAYQKAAKYQTAYYGLLAAEKLGLTLDSGLVDVGEPGPGWKTASFAKSSVLAAGRLIAQSGNRPLAARFFLHLGESLSDAELGQLADLALRLDEPYIAVLVAKAAAERGVILPRAYFPVPDMVPDQLPVSRALALSISRRESEFNPAAQSKAGARGLMQVMPATAEMLAKAAGEEFSASRLITDPAFNVRMGSTYLSHMTEKFGPAVALIASGYNAGPGRPVKWIDQYGDPRRDSVDVVDWVESIPFTETRTYVMRVAEGVVIYRARLKGQPGPVRITAELTGR
jgi:soluble lytic murein transglycosylase